MKRLYIIVEGQTEEEFVKSLVQPFFQDKKIFNEITPIKIRTSKSQKGGLLSYYHIKNDILNLLRNQRDILVTTFIDLYGLPNNFPGFEEAQNIDDHNERVKYIENAFNQDVNDIRFIAYIQKYEFEALLFSSLSGFNQYWSNNNKIIAQINEIISEFPNPEEIDDSPLTAPSKRIMGIIPNYEKVIFGNLIALEIGIENILRRCSRFNDWISQIITNLQT